MINRFPGLTPTRSRAVVHDGLVFTVAVAPDPVTSSMYEQTVKALGRIDESLALCGSDKSRILSAIVYITDIKRKGEMNRAWDEWVDSRKSADAGLHRRRSRTAAYRGDRGDGREVSRSSFRARAFARTPNPASRRCDLDFRVHAKTRVPEMTVGFNTPPSCWPPCWSAPDRGSSRSCRAPARSSRAHLR